MVIRALNIQNEPMRVLTGFDYFEFTFLNQYEEIFEYILRIPQCN